MPHIDETAKAWQLDLAGRVGAAVLARRKVLGLTAVQLAERTRALGYPITRVAITKIENNARAGKLDVSELLVLGKALEIPPALLLFPGYPDGKVKLLPGFEAASDEAVRWVSGAAVWPIKFVGTSVEVSGSNDGTELVDEADTLLKYGMGIMEETFAGGESAMTRELIGRYEAKAEQTATKIARIRARLWGESDG